MASIYLTQVAGSGGPADGFRPDIIGSYSVLMIDPAANAAVVLALDDTLAGGTVDRLATASSVDALRTLLQNTAPNNPRRNTVNTWLTGHGYQPLTAQVQTWWDVIHYVARQVNPDADLAVAFVG